MSDDRKTMSVSEANYEQFQSEFAREDETIDEAFSRLLDAVDGDTGSDKTADVLRGVLDEYDVATAGDVDDVLTNVPSETAGEVENRLTRR